MSNIRIECRKNKYYNKDQKSYNKEIVDDKLDDELIITADQWFMDTRTFFNDVRQTLKDYFDVIDKK